MLNQSNPNELYAFMNDLTCLISVKQTLGGSNLYLVGMMGCGKSQTGPHLAKKLGYAFVDIDEVIEKAAKKTIPRIFAEDGESCFRQLESQFLKEIGTRHSLVVATGGGLVTTPRNWGILHQGVVIWLDPGRDRLLHRIQSDQKIRPLLQKANFIDTFDALLKDRNPIYLQSDLHVNVEDQSPQEVSLLILDQLNCLLKKQGDLNV